MADTYAEFVQLAQEMIAEFGRTVSLQKLSASSTDTSKPWNGTGAPSVDLQLDNVPAVFVDPRGMEIKTVVKDDELLKRVSEVALIAGQDQDLSRMNVLVDAGDSFRIEWVQVLRPGDTTCLYVFGAKR